MSDRTPSYSDKSDYLRAMSERLTPDLWDAVVVRAIHDATVGKLPARNKAREWLAKYLLPQKMDIQLTGNVAQEGVRMRVKDIRTEEEAEPYFLDVRAGRRELLSDEHGYYFTELKEVTIVTSSSGEFEVVTVPEPSDPPH